jgi:excisionase family DNA binding protein
MNVITFEHLPKAVAMLCEKMEEQERLLQKLLDQAKAPQSEQDVFLTVPEAADFLKIGIPTLYGYTQRAEIPCFRKGKRLYFSKMLLRQWIEQGRKMTPVEIRQEAEKYLQRTKNRV